MIDIILRNDTISIDADSHVFAVDERGMEVNTKKREKCVYFDFSK